jgi:hypothetical protein
MATTKQHRDAREMLYLVEEYKRVHKVDEIDLAAVAHWAFTEGRWKRPPFDPEAILRRELARAMRNDHIKDPQGREVRKYHPVLHYEGERKISIWQTIDTARPDHMRVSFQQRRQGISWRCIQLNLDFDSYAENNIYAAALPPISFNFDPDVEEAGFPTVYDDDPDDPEENG